MRLLSFKQLKKFWNSGYADAEEPIRRWHDIVKTIDVLTPHSIKTLFPSASFVGNDRIVFNIAGNKYRLIVRARFDEKILFVRFIGTHAQYDKINAREI